jgi:zinc protease
VANDVLAVSGYGKYSSSDLRKLLVGKNVRSSVQIDNMYESVEANTTPDDLETAFQLVYLKATDARRDDAAFANFMQNTRMRIENRTTNATVAMGDSIHANVYGHHPFGSKLYAADIDNINYDTILAMHRERFSDMSDFTFFVIGNFDEDSLRTYVQKYIATLPAAGRMEHPKDAGYRYGKGFVDRKFFMPMETPQTIDYAFYSGNCDYTVQNVVFASAFGQILSSKLYQDVREARGWTYGIKTHCSVSAGMNGDDPAVFILPVYIRVAPENADETQQIVDDTFNAMCHTDGFITDDEVLKVKQYMLKNYASNANDNTYWYTVLKAYARFGSDMHTDFAKAVNLLTPQSIEQFAQKNLVPTSRIRLQMCPQ